MSNRNDFKLKLMDNIDESLVDRATAKRAKLMSELLIRAAAMKKKMIRFGSLAACLCILISAFTVFMVLLNRKQVPIYRGMSVSQLSPFVSADIGELPEGAVLFIADDERMMMLDNSGKHPNLEGNNGNHNGQLKDETLFTDDMTEYVTEEPTETPWDPNAEAAAPLFYAEQGKDFYVTVHIDNPDSFEILSFTLNGKKYSSYMFEEGSDMESLVLKCNAGDAVGILNYTIDAIKYIDGEKIKDVKMEGNKTVRVGIYSEQLMPTFSSAEVATSYDSFTVGGMVNDTYGLAEDGELYARIYEGTEWVLSMDITAGEPFLTTFDSLKPNTQYSFVIEGLFDDLSGVGAEMHVLYKHQFTTPALLTATVDSVGFHDATLSLHKHEHATGLVVDTIELYLGEEKIADLTGDSFTAEELLADNEYTLKLGYTDKEIKYTDEFNFRTEAYIAKVEIGSVTSEKHSLGFELVETDEHERGQITAIELWQGDQLIKSLEDLSARSFDGLYANNTYTLKITYTYDLLDGKGQQETVVEKELTTKAYKTPTANFSNLVFSPDSVGFDLEITDSDSVGQLDRIELWLDDELIATKGTDARAFEGLEVLNTYSVKAIYLCDMQDGKGEIETELTCSIVTQSAGLAISYGKVTGIGDCTDTTVYINMSVADNAFKKNFDIEKVIIGPGATSIGTSAFYSCSSITEIVLYNGVADIGSHAFEWCESLLNIFIPASVEAVGEYAIAGNRNMKYIAVAHPSKPSTWSQNWHGPECPASEFWNVKSIYTDEQGVTYAEQNDGTLTVMTCDRSVTSVILPDTVVTIGNNAFAHCQALEEINIPDGVKSINQNAFFGCRSLSSVNIPDSVTTIGNSAFSNCSSLSSINIPESVTTIDSNAFYNCTSLAFIYVPDSVTTVGYDAFGSSCTVLTDHKSQPSGWDKLWDNLHYSSYAPAVYYSVKRIYTDEQGVTYAEHNDGTLTVIDCDESVTSVVLPDNVAAIGPRAFANCNNLQEINIPDSATGIGSRAFATCVSLNEISIPKSVTHIEDNAFISCYSMTIFTEHKTKPTKWEKDWNSSDCTVYWNAKCAYTDSQGVTYVEHFDGTLTVLDCDESVTSVVLPDKVVAIGNHAFESCKKLTTINIPNGVTTIGGRAFSKCSALTSINIPNSVTKIGNDAFFSCFALSFLHIPSSVTDIGECCFEADAPIFTEHAKKPEGWHFTWHGGGGTVYWNVKRIYTEGGKTYIEYNDGSVKPLS